MAIDTEHRNPQSAPVGMPPSPRKQAVRAHFDRVAADRDDWRYTCFIVPAGTRVLELGCSTGVLLDRPKPSHGVGTDLSDTMIEVVRADNRRCFREQFPDLALRGRNWLSLFAYPLTGGFKNWSLFPNLRGSAPPVGGSSPLAASRSSDGISIGHCPGSDQV